MTSEEIPVAIVGAGTVGTLLAGHFLRAGHEDIAIVDVPARIEQIRQNGIRVSQHTSIDARPKHLFTDVAQLAGLNVRTLFVATKSNHLETLGPELKKVHHPGMIVVSFQNGIGTEGYIARFIDPAKVARVTVNFAGNRDEDAGDVSMSWFHPPNHLGPYADQDLAPFEQLAGLLSDIGLETRAVSHTEIKRQVFYKTVLNAALNALCATSSLTMAEAMRMRHTRELARHLLREALTVAAHVGYHYGEDALDRCMGYIDKGGDHYPSMWYDLQAKRRTEIDFINGKIVQVAMMYTHVDVGLNRFFSTMVMTEEIKSGVRSADDVPGYLACKVRLCY